MHVCLCAEKLYPPPLTLRYRAPMFTGLVETTGRLVSFDRTPTGRALRISAPELVPHLTLGESLAVNGCCLTVTSTDGEFVQFDLLTETLACTNLGDLTLDSRLNLERALAANARLGGHFVQGHVDCTTPVRDISDTGGDLGITIDLPSRFAHYVIPKGSIAINGVSLTVAALAAPSLTVWIIPHTRAETNLGDLQPGQAVNLEFDVLAKYAARQLRPLVSAANPG